MSGSVKDEIARLRYEARHLLDAIVARLKGDEA